MTYKLVRLADVADMNPRLPRDHGYADSKEISFVPMSAIDELGGVIREHQPRAFGDVKKGYTSFRNNDVLFAKITPCMENGKSAIAKGLIGDVGFGSTEFHVLRAKAGVMPEWLFYFVRQDSFRREAKKNFTGTAGQQRVPTSFLENSVIPLPPLSEQQRIVDILSRAEGIVRLRREAQHKAAEIIPALFLDMFGDPATNPKGWPTLRLDEVTTVKGGGTPSKSKLTYWDGDIPWVSPKDMKSQLISSAEDHITQSAIEESATNLLPAGSILMVTRSGILRHTLPIGTNTVPVAINQDLKAFIPSESILPEFLLAQLNFRAPEILSGVRTGATVQNLETEAVRRMLVTLPDLHSQRVFDKRAQQARSVMAMQTIALDKASATFDALLAQSFAPPTARQVAA